jgi:hypothetical protein
MVKHLRWFLLGKSFQLEHHLCSNLRLLQQTANHILHSWLWLVNLVPRRMVKTSLPSLSISINTNLPLTHSSNVVPFPIRRFLISFKYHNLLRTITTNHKMTYRNSHCMILRISASINRAILHNKINILNLEIVKGNPKKYLNLKLNSGDLSGSIIKTYR